MADTPPHSPTDATVLDYVRASAGLLELPLDAAQIERVAMHLTRTRALAALLRDFALAPEDEPAELFCPAPFPVDDTAGDAR